MPTAEEEIGRILDEYGDRLSRIEDRSFEEGVPNPLVAATDTTRSTVSARVDSEPSGSMQWGADQWGASEWNPQGT